MQLVVVTVPALWADHHVIAARQALVPLPGVASIMASAADRQVRVEIDPEKTDAAAVLTTLAEAGFRSGELDAQPSGDGRASWLDRPRVTATNAVDLSMSGDHRKY